MLEKYLYCVINQLVGHSVSQATSYSISHPFNQSGIQSLNQSTN